MHTTKHEQKLLLSQKVHELLPTTVSFHSYGETTPMELRLNYSKNARVIKTEMTRSHLATKLYERSAGRIISLFLPEPPKNFDLIVSVLVALDTSVSV